MSKIIDNSLLSISLAGYVVGIHGCSDLCRHICRNYLAPSEAPIDIFIKLSCNDIAREAALNGIDAKADDFEGKAIRYESLALHRKTAESLIPFDVLQMHGSAIAVDGQAYLFTAPSGTGKSTHTRLWREHFGERAIMVNDDKPLLRLEDNQVLACGSPWNGKHHLGNNIQAPLKGICFLERGETNAIRRVTPEAGFAYALKQTYRPDQPELAAKTIETLSAVVAQVPIYIMTMNNYKDDAAQVAYEGMR